jgi:hypothetical protein
LRAKLADNYPVLVLVGLVAFLLLVLVVALSPIGNPPSQSFYNSAAAIMPLLVIALAVEKTARDAWSQEFTEFKLVLMVVLCVGELVAIVGASGVASNFSVYDQNNLGLVGPSFTTTVLMAAVTAYSLAVGFLAVVAVAFVKAPGARNARGRAYMVTHFWPGATEDQYQATVAAVHPPRGLPDGQSYHVAGPTEGGILITAVWDSKAQWDRFLEKLIASMPIEGGVEGQPQERSAEVINLVKA